MNKKFNFPPSACIDCWRLSHKECPEGYTEPNKSRIVCKNHIKDNNQTVIQCRDCIRDYCGNCPETPDTQCEVIRGNIECKSYYKMNTKQMDEQQKDIQENKGVKYDGDKPLVALVIGGFRHSLRELEKTYNHNGEAIGDMSDVLFSSGVCLNDINTLYGMTMLVLQELSSDILFTKNFFKDLNKSIMLVCAVGSFGAKKYAENNWMGLEDGEKRTLNAAMRHIMAYMSGEINNHEEFEKDGVKYTCDLPHLAHAAWELLACIEFARYRLGMESTAREAQEKLCR